MPRPLLDVVSGRGWVQAMLDAEAALARAEAKAGVIPCDGSAPAVDLTDTVTAGSSSLSYDAGSDQYNYIWKSDSAWAGQCRQLLVTLSDGSIHVANFKFK